MSNPKYELTLHRTYYQQGFFNLGVDADRFVQPTSGEATIYLGKSKSTYPVRINREANQNGTPRIMGGVAARDWFQKNHQEKDLVTVEILSPKEFWLY